MSVEEPEGNKGRQKGRKESAGKLTRAIERAGQELATERLTREYLNSPSVRMAQEIYNSPSARMAREIARSPEYRIAQEMARTLGTAKLAKIDDLGRTLAQTAASASRMPMLDAFEHSRITALSKRLNGIPTDVLSGLHGLRPLKIDPALASTISQAQRTVTEMLAPLGTMSSELKESQDRQRALHAAMIEPLGSTVGEIARVSQWSRNIAALGHSEINRVLGGNVAEAVEQIRHTLGATFRNNAALDQARMAGMLGLDTRFGEKLAATQLKMSSLAGVSQTFDFQSPIQLEAYRSLLGDWRTSTDLPQEFWRDSRVRRRMYREAEVDEGLVTAQAGVALEVIIESGLAPGIRTDGRAVAVVSLGGVSMTVRSRGTGNDAYLLVTHFEQELRAFIERKLEGRYGPDWFKLRASHLLGKAKATRKAALQRGETFASLVHFTELGELSDIIQNKEHWDQVFGDVFIHKDEIKHDMQKLIAVRRPTAHSRHIDGVRLVEVICVVQRLSNRMLGDGEWAVAAESDR